MTSQIQDRSSDRLRELQELLNREIPLTAALKLGVISYDGRWLRLAAPLAENINRSGTVFAGSLNAVVTLAGWGMVWFVLQECKLQGETVIQDSTCNYLVPVNMDFSAICEKPDNERLRRFEKTLRERGKARLELSVSIHEGDVLAVSFKGRYVVQLHEPSRIQE